MQVETRCLHSSLESSIDKGPYINLKDDGMIAAMTSGVDNENTEMDDNAINQEANPENNDAPIQTENMTEDGRQPIQEPANSSGHNTQGETYSRAVQEITAPIKRSINQISRRHGWSMWMLAYVVIITTWPLLGSWISLVFRKRRLRGARPTSLNRR